MENNQQELLQVLFENYFNSILLMLKAKENNRDDAFYYDIIIKSLVGFSDYIISKNISRQSYLSNTPYRLPPYLYGIVKNRLLDAIKKIKSDRLKLTGDFNAFDIAMEFEPLTFFEKILKDSEGLSNLLKSKLREKQYKFFKYRLIDKLTDEDVRKELGIPNQNAYGAFKSRTLKKIRELPEIQHYIQKIYSQ